MIQVYTSQETWLDSVIFPSDLTRLFFSSFILFFSPKLVFNTSSLPLGNNVFLLKCVCMHLCLPAKKKKKKSHWYRTKCQNTSCSIQSRLSCQGHIFLLSHILTNTESAVVCCIFSTGISCSPPPSGHFKLVESGHFLCVSRRSVLWQSAKLFSLVYWDP